MHDFMLSSPACWAAYGAVLAAEYSEARLFHVHHLSVDAYAVQHPGDFSRKARQSVQLHLARLCLELERGVEAAAIYEITPRLVGRLPRGDWDVEVPTSFSVTVADVAPLAGTPRHADAVHRWARAAWAEWGQVRREVRRWVETV